MKPKPESVTRAMALHDHQELSRLGRLGSQARRRNQIWLEWKLDQILGPRPAKPDPFEPVLNNDGDIVPRADLM